MSSPFLPESPLGAPDRAEEFAPRQQELPPGDSLRPAAGQLRPPVGHEPSGQVPAFSREQRIKAAEMGLVNKRAQMRGTVVGLTGGAIVYYALRRYMPPNLASPNVVLMGSIVAGSLAGWYESRSLVSAGMEELAKRI